MPKAGFDFRVDVTDDQVTRMFQQMEQYAYRDIYDTLREVLADALRHAEEVQDILIYDTPPRGGYERTGHLKDALFGFVRTESAGPALYLLDKADYATYVELGTWELGVSLEEVRARAEVAARSNQDLVIVRYGQGPPGMEPRPSLIPTLVFIEFRIPQQMILYFRRHIKGFYLR